MIKKIFTLVLATSIAYTMEKNNDKKTIFPTCMPMKDARAMLNDYSLFFKNQCPQTHQFEMQNFSYVGVQWKTDYESSTFPYLIFMVPKNIEMQKVCLFQEALIQQENLQNIKLPAPEDVVGVMMGCHLRRTHDQNLSKYYKIELNQFKNYMSHIKPKAFAYSSNPFNYPEFLNFFFKQDIFGTDFFENAWITIDNKSYSPIYQMIAKYKNPWKFIVRLFPDIKRYNAFLDGKNKQNEFDTMKNALAVRHIVTSAPYAFEADTNRIPAEFKNFLSEIASEKPNNAQFYFPAVILSFASVKRMEDFMKKQHAAMKETLANVADLKDSGLSKLKIDRIYYDVQCKSQRSIQDMIDHMKKHSFIIQKRQVSHRTKVLMASLQKFKQSQWKKMLRQEVQQEIIGCGLMQNQTKDSYAHQIKFNNQHKQIGVRISQNLA